jgi:hypothetical protein
MNEFAHFIVPLVQGVEAAVDAHSDADEAVAVGGGS